MIHPHQQPIVGGHVNHVGGDFNFQVALMTVSGLIYCGGFILTPKVAGTAAHCVVNRTPGNHLVGFGSVERSSLLQRDILSFKHHASFNSHSGDFDVAVVTIVGSFDGVNVAPIPLNNKQLSPGTSITISGWGRTNIDKSLPNFLKSTTIQKWEFQSCKFYYRSYKTMLTENMMCGKSSSGGACNGDSGGPLTYNGTLVGIVSFGDSTCRIFPTVFTDVSSPPIRSWLIRNVASLKQG